MTITCPACGFENRDKAHFCLGCAKPIKDAVTAAAEQAARRERASAARKRRRQRRKMPSPNRTRNQRIFITVGVLAAAVLVAGLVSQLRRSGTTLVATPTVATKPAPATTAPAAPSAADTPQEATSETGEASPLDAVERLRLSVEQIEREDRARAIAREEQVRAAAAQRRRGDDTRTPAQSVPSDATGAPTPHDNGPAVAAAAPAQSPTASTPVTAAASAATSVDQLCANAGNMLMRDLCRIRECAKPAHAQDGVCVRFRKMDEERKAQDEYR